MLEIDVTDLLSEDPSNFSASVLERGTNAGQITWDNAINRASTPLLNSDSAIEEMRRWAKASGGWDATEVAAFTPLELQALFIQLVSGDYREAGMPSSPEEWAQYHEDSAAGIVPGNLFCHNSCIFFLLAAS